MRDRVLLGMLTPSSNTVLEPVTSAMVAGMPEVSGHFSRFSVTELSLSNRALQQFDPTLILDAARLLADARVQVIAWNGTSAAWLGFDSDERLCRGITAATGISATTSILALNEILARNGVARFGLVTPYLDQIQAKILENYAGLGLQCVAERHLNDPGNFLFFRNRVGDDRGDGPRRREGKPTGDRHRLHQSSRGPAGRGARAGNRHPNFEFNLCRRLAIAPSRGRRAAPCARLGSPLFSLPAQTAIRTSAARHDGGLTWSGLGQPFCFVLPPDKSATGKHHMPSLFVRCQDATVTVNGRTLPGKPVPREIRS